MDQRRLLVVVAGMLLAAAGCASSTAPKQASVPPPKTDDYNAIKAAYLAANPDSRVGRVAAVLPLDARLAIEDIPVAEFRKGDVLSVVDGKLNAIADCEVVDVDADLVYVHYEPVTVGSPPPVVGDLAIRAEAAPH